MEALLSRASEVVSLISKPGADPDHAEAKQNTQDLRAIYFALASQAQSNPLRIGSSERKQIWDLACKIWVGLVDQVLDMKPPHPDPVHNCFLHKMQNYSVEVSRSSKNSDPEAWHAQLCHIASDLASLIQEEQQTDQEVACKLSFFHATGQQYAKLGEFEAAEACYAKASEYGSCLMDMASRSTEADQLVLDNTVLVVEVYIDRACAAWSLKQQELARNLLAKAYLLVSSGPLPGHQAILLALQIVETKLDRAKQLLEEVAKPGAEGAKRDVAEAVGLLEGAYEDVTKLEVDEDDPAFDTHSAAASKLNAQILSSLALAYILSGDRGIPAMTCISKLRRLEASDIPSHNLTYLAIKALLQLDKPKEVESELLSLVSSEEAPLELCTDALSSMLEVPGFPGTIASAASLILKRKPGDPQLPVQLVEVILSKSDVKESCKEYEGIALDVISDEAVMSSILQEGSSEASTQQERLHALLWNQAARYFQAKDFAAATRFFAADLHLAPTEEKAKIARALAMCSLGLRQLERALEYVGIANEVSLGSIYTSFIAFKVYLEKDDSAGACKELASMMESSDFSPDFLMVSAHEAISGGQLKVAKEAIEHLHELITSKSKEAAVKGQEALVLRNLIKIAIEAAKQAQQPPFKELSRHYSSAAARNKELGQADFFGDNEGRLVQLEWFAASAWNHALEAAKVPDNLSAMALCSASAEFYAAHPAQEPGCLNSQKMAYLLAASAAMQASSQEADDKSYLETAKMLLAKVRQVIEVIQRTRQGPGSTTTDKALIFCLLQEFDLALRMGDRSRQMAVLADCRTIKDFTAENFLKMAQLCHQGSTSNAATEKVCLSAALQSFTQQTPVTAFASIAQTLRRILCLSNSDTEKLSLYADARTLLNDVPAGSLPAREVAWLVTTAFNRGCQHAKFCRYDTARQFMQTAVEMLPFSPELEAKREGMLAELARLEELQKGGKELHDMQ